MWRCLGWHSHLFFLIQFYTMQIDKEWEFTASKLEEMNVWTSRNQSNFANSGLVEGKREETAFLHFIDLRLLFA